MDDTVHQVDEFRPEHLAILITAKHGVGKEARMIFADAVTQKFGFIPPAELDRIWRQATTTQGG